MREPKYPFVPKSTNKLLPGQFWGIPLKDGRFACGRVITLCTRNDGKLDPRIFLAGLMDWVGSNPPTFDSLVQRRTLEQGGVHIRTIIHAGGGVLGLRSLELDSLEPDLFLSQSPGPGCYLQRGFELLRTATTKEQAELQVFGTWGYSLIQLLAERQFGKSK